MIAVLALTAIILVMSAASLATVLRTRRDVPVLAETAAPTPATGWPRLSIVVPACNEVDSLRPAMQSLLAEDYPNLEVVLVDDRSTDGTAAVADALAAGDARVRVLHVETLPAGWLGKVHALHVGVQAATGDWIVITDADVVYARGTLRKAVGYALERRRDFVTMWPELTGGGPVLRLAYAGFVTAVLLTIRAWEIPDAKKAAWTGIGHFMLLRREAFERTAGFSWLRMEVVDDGALGLMMKRSGASCEFLNGAGQLRLTWYPSFRAMADGLAKNMYGAVAHYRVARLVQVSAFLGACQLLPLAAAASAPGLTAAYFALTAATGAAAASWLRLPISSGLGLWLGTWLQLYCLWLSAYRCLRDGGITWRGTRYPLAAMRAGLRVAGAATSGPAAKSFSLPSGREIEVVSADEARILVQELWREGGYVRHGLRLEPGAVVVDAGANIGVFTIWVDEHLGGNARVLAFEPVADVHRLLARNLSYAPERLRAFAFGLSDHDENQEIRFHPRMTLWSTRDGTMDETRRDELRRSSGRMLTQLAAHLQEQATWSERIAGKVLARLPRPLGRRLAAGAVASMSEVQSVACRFRPLGTVLDELGIDRVDLLKIDTEGDELRILQGVGEARWPRIRQVALEVDGSGPERAGAAVAFLEARGFRVATEAQLIVGVTYAELGCQRHQPIGVYARRE
ncbi:MAG: FkbM family methyltransferase [Candidatus Schekmanbacteria bacterium]|nr:FkbM family methyltransferase [Candidatus Schekmanbacteria bacterium]